MHYLLTLITILLIFRFYTNEVFERVLLLESLISSNRNFNNYISFGYFYRWGTMLTYLESAIIISILLMRTLRFRAIKPLAHAYRLRVNIQVQIFFLQSKSS